MTGWMVGAGPTTRSSSAPPASPSGKAKAATARSSSVDQRDAVITGTVEEAVGQLRELHEAGCHRVMAQHLLHRDTEAIELIGREVAPLVEGF